MTERTMIALDETLVERLLDALEKVTAALARLDVPKPATAGLSVAEVARELRLSVRSVESMVADGSIAAVRFGRRVVVPRSEVERVLTTS